MWGARGPLPPAAAMVAAVVTPVVFVLRLLKSAKKTLKLVICKQTYQFFTIIGKHTTTHIMLIVVWPEPKPLWSKGTLAYQILPEI
jgi:hypothetical protein